MQTTTRSDNLPLVRRLEAVGFRAWPAASVVYDGSWQVRLTGGHPSKRLNCLVPLDPSDYRDMDVRLEKAGKRFESYGRPLTLRETPLAPTPLLDLIARKDWSRFETVSVMTGDLAQLELSEALDRLPSHDVGRFVDANLHITGEDKAQKPALAEIISAIKPPHCMFTIEDTEAGPVAAVLCVQDNDLAGILSLGVAEPFRRRGLGAEILSCALRWARLSGAKTAWLQVDAANEAAISLYSGFGFQEAYRYHYWRRDTA